MIALNEAAFKKQHWALMARGFKVDDWFDRHGCRASVERNGGIEPIQRVHLRLGQRYYRFADLTHADSAKFGGAWWVDFEQLHKIMEACSSRGLNLSQMARTFLAVPWEWNRADAIVSGILKEPMDAYEGRGRPVRFGKSYEGRYSVDGGAEYPGNPNLRQIFIPDMRSHWNKCFEKIDAEELRIFTLKHRNVIRV